MKKANKEKAKKEKAEIPSKPLFEGEHMDDCFMCYNGGGECPRVELRKHILPWFINVFFCKCPFSLPDLVCCDYCDKAYHLDCHIPPLTEIPKGLWKCQECAAVEYTRMMKCGECNACVRKDCGKCSHCLDKPKFGGPNKIKQVCLKKKCPYLRFAPPAKVSTKKASPGKTKERKKELKLQFSTGAHSTNKKRKRHNSEGAGNSVHASTKIAGASVESYTLQDDLKLQSADGVSNRAVHDAAETSTNTANASVKSNTQQNDLKLQSTDVISNSSVHDAPQTSMNTAGGSVESSTIHNGLELQSGDGVSNITDFVGNTSKVAQKLNDNGGRTVMSRSLLTRDIFSKKKKGRPPKRRKVEPSSTACDGAANDSGQPAKKHEPTPDFFTDKKNDSISEDMDIEKIVNGTPLKNDPVGNKIRLIIVKALTHPAHHKIQDKACEKLRKMVASVDIVSQIIHLGGLKMVSKAMRDHLDKTIVQAEASALLAELVWVNPPCITDIIAEGCLSLVLISMKRHDTNPKVQQMGCGFFRAMSYDFANHPIINSVNGVGAVIDSMKRNSKQYDVLKEGCYFLQNLLCNPGILPGTIQLIVSEGIALKIIDSIHEKADDDEYHGAACGLLANLTLDDGAREHIGGYDSSVSTLLAVLGLGADVDACKCSLTALKLLASGNVDIKDRIVRQGGMKTTMELLTLHNSDVVMVDSGLGLLSELTNNNSKISQLLLDLEGLEFVTNAMVHHSSSSHVQVRACEVLRNLPICENEVNGAAQLILKAMKYRADSIVQYAGCRALLHCCCRSPATVELLQSEEDVLRRSHFTP